MMGKTHITIGVGYGITLLPIWINGEVSIVEYGLIIAGLAVGSLAPDLDHRESIATRRVPVIGWIISRVVNHRGIFHSVLGFGLWCLAVSLLCASGIVTGSVLGMDVSQSLVFIGAGFLTGYALHIVADIVTHGGVRLFYPLHTKVSLGLMSTGGIAEYGFRVLIIFLCSLYASQLLV